MKPLKSKFMLTATAVLLAFASVTGCAERQIFDETGLTTVTGFDLLPDGHLRGTSVMPVINPEAQEKIQVFSAVSDTSKGIRDKTNLQSDKKVLGGQLRVVLMNKKLAQQGIIGILDTYYRDPSIGSRLYLCVAEGSTNELLTYKFKEEGNIGIYLYRMIEQNVQGEKIPSPTLHEFFRSYFSEGSDPFLPLIGRKGDEVEIKGVALFHKDRLVGTITPEEAFFIKLIRDQFRVGSYQTTIPFEKLGLKKPDQETSMQQKKAVHLVFDPVSSSTDIKVTRRNPAEFEVKVRMQARILEISALLNLGDTGVMKRMKIAMEENMVQQLEKIAKKLQKWEVDPVGFGDKYRAQVRGARKLKHEEWHKLFKEAKIRFHVEAEIIRSGIAD